MRGYAAYQALLIPRGVVVPRAVSTGLIGGGVQGFEIFSSSAAGAVTLKKQPLTTCLKNNIQGEIELRSHPFSLLIFLGGFYEAVKEWMAS